MDHAPRPQHPPEWVTPAFETEALPQSDALAVSFPAFAPVGQNFNPGLCPEC